MLFICYPRCSTCKKARKWLDDHAAVYETRDISEDNPTEAELRAWQKKSGLPLKRFFNTSGMQYITDDTVIPGFKEESYAAAVK